MKTIEEINVKELKEMIKKVNATGVLPTHIKFNGVTNLAAYNNFVDAMNKVDEATAVKLADLCEEALDYYNNLFDDSDFPAEEEVETVIESEPEPEVETVVEMVADPNSDPTVPEFVEESKPEPETNEETEVSRNFKRLSKTKMTPKIDGSLLIVTFKDLGVSESFLLPEHGDKEALKAARKKAFDFAKMHGATKGQIQHISKELNDNGYYMR